MNTQTFKMYLLQ